MSHLIAIGSAKGSPGATTLAVALALRWANAQPLVVEADPAGGDLAARHHLHQVPGLTEFAADCRRGELLNPAQTYIQRLSLGVDVILGPGADLAQQGVGMLAGVGLKVLPALSTTRTTLVDLGRLDLNSPALPLLGVADRLVLVGHGGLDALDAIEIRAKALAPAGFDPTKTTLAVVGPSHYSDADVHQATGIAVMVRLPYDRKAADVIAGRAKPGLGWSRLELFRSARALAEQLVVIRVADSTTIPDEAPIRLAEVTS